MDLKISWVYNFYNSMAANGVDETWLRFYLLTLKHKYVEKANEIKKYP